MNPNDPNVSGNQGMPINPLPPPPPVTPQQPEVLPPPNPPINTPPNNIDQNIPVTGVAQTPFQPPTPSTNMPPVEPMPQNNVGAPQPANYQDPAQPVLSPDPSKVVGSFDQPQPIPMNNMPNPVPQQPIAQGGNNAFLGQQSKKPSKKIIMIIVFALFLLVVIGGGYFAFTKFMGGTKLESFSNSHFSIKYPKGYEKDETDTDAEFTEPGSEEKTKSYVQVNYGDSSVEVSDELLNTAFKAIEGDINTQISYELKSNQKAENGKSERIDHDGSKALKVAADVTEEGKKIGTVHILFGVIKKTYYSVVLFAHNSDPGLEKKTDTILASMHMK